MPRIVSGLHRYQGETLTGLRYFPSVTQSFTAPDRSLAGKPPSQRQRRVAEEIRHQLAALFTRHEFRDPDLAEADLTVTEVRVSPDLRHATVFISRLGRADAATLLPNLARATPYLRGILARQLRLRVAPDLSFQPDTSLDYAARMNALLHSPEVARDLEMPDPDK